MDVGIPEERFAQLRNRYNMLLQIEEKLILAIKNPKIVKKNIQSYYSQIETSKRERKILAQHIKELTDLIILTERQDEEDDIIPEYIHKSSVILGDRPKHLKEIKMKNDLSQGGVNDINDPSEY
jgi:hypothetical protein